MQRLSGFARFSGVAPIRNRWTTIADQVLAKEREFQHLDDLGIRKRSLSLKYQVLSGVSPKELAADAFALVREAARRHLGLCHYRVQLIGGMAMLDGAIAVMQTGEGKTLAATLPLYLAALAGKGAHLVTSNDYLAARDAESMTPLFAALGLSTGVVVQATPHERRRQAYGCDITYATAKEIGFDFLRDRLMLRNAELSGMHSDPQAIGVQRGFHFMLIDEADSILIDEARTPLVISSIPSHEEDRCALRRWAAKVAPEFTEEQDFEYDESTGSLNLTSRGRRFARKINRSTTMDRISQTEMYEGLEMALQVQMKFFRDRHYIVRNEEVVIVDEFTGRMAEGRKWRAGLHQAIEAREGLEITAETAEAARITVQDLFLKYPYLCGMTGTVAGSARELKSIYGTPCAKIPTNRPPQRKQMSDRVFGTADAKWNAIVTEVTECQNAGRPVLIGTRSIDKSEIISALLQKAGVEHHVLNARYLEQEAVIVAQAGQSHQVTVATNMAGRGTDIRLSDAAREAGGLHVIISELHESERIDRQLIGRSGRQGDPGSFRFYMALDDEILLHGLGIREARRLKKLGQKQTQVSPQLARVFRKAQSKVESSHFRGRKILLFHEGQRREVQHEMGQDPYVDTLL